MSDYFTLNFAKNIAKIEDANGIFTAKRGVAIDSDTLSTGKWELSVRTEMMRNINDIKRMPVQVIVTLKYDGVVASHYYTDGQDDTFEVVLWWQLQIGKSSDAGFRKRNESEKFARGQWKSLDNYVSRKKDSPFKG